MDDAIRVFSGRTFSSEDIELIKWARQTYAKLPRYEFAETVCELLDWNTPAGKAKWHPCLEFLEESEAEGLIQLPPVKVKKPTSGKIKVTAIDFNIKEISGEVKNFEAIQLKVVQPGEELQRWRAYVEQYHMLGFKTVFGSRLQYFIKSGDIELGCMQFSASSWALEERDKWIGWTGNDRKVRLNLIINNSIFLIFPWVHIRNLASKALSMAAKQIPWDWLREYCYAPVLLETFVDLEHFKGTCYKAANWVYLVAVDGSQKFTRDYQWQKEALERHVGEEPIPQYYVYVLESVLILDNGITLPVLTETLNNSDWVPGQTKQDSESKAFDRLARKLYRIFGRGNVTLVADGLYACSPVIRKCREYRWDYMITLKEGSIPDVWKKPPDSCGWN